MVSFGSFWPFRFLPLGDLSLGDERLGDFARGGFLCLLMMFPLLPRSGAAPNP
jgi:hypothetical protein